MGAGKPRFLGRGVAAALALATATVALARPSDEARIEQIGATSLVYNGAMLAVGLSYRFARADLGSQWLLLEVEMTATRRSVEVPRSAIAIQTPRGAVVPLATQAAFAEAFSSLRARIAAANVAGEPLNVLIPRPPRRLAYFADPGYHLVFASVWLNPQWNYYGRLFFQVPGGTESGRYALRIDLPGHPVCIPFTL